MFYIKSSVDNLLMTFRSSSGLVERNKRSSIKDHLVVLRLVKSSSVYLL